MATLIALREKMPNHDQRFFRTHQTESILRLYGRAWPRSRRWAGEMSPRFTNQAFAMGQQKPSVKKLGAAAIRVFTGSQHDFSLAIIASTSAPWKYALPPIPGVCRNPGAFSFLALVVSGVRA